MRSYFDFSSPQGNHLRYPDRMVCPDSDLRIVLDVDGSRSHCDLTDRRPFCTFRVSADSMCLRPFQMWIQKNRVTSADVNPDPRRCSLRTTCFRRHTNFGLQGDEGRRDSSGVTEVCDRSLLLYLIFLSSNVSGSEEVNEMEPEQNSTCGRFGLSHLRHHISHDAMLLVSSVTNYIHGIFIYRKYNILLSLFNNNPA